MNQDDFYRTIARRRLAEPEPVVEEPVNVAGLAAIAIGMLAFWVVFLWMLFQ